MFGSYIYVYNFLSGMLSSARAGDVYMRGSNAGDAWFYPAHGPVQERRWFYGSNAGHAWFSGCHGPMPDVGSTDPTRVTCGSTDPTDPCMRDVGSTDPTRVTCGSTDPTDPCMRDVGSTDPTRVTFGSTDPTGPCMKDVGAIRMQRGSRLVLRIQRTHA